MIYDQMQACFCQLIALWAACFAAAAVFQQHFQSSMPFCMLANA
jgi:hypothetical protein